MEFFNRIKHTFLNLFRHASLEEDATEEIRLHLQHLEEKYESQGMSRSKAKKAALQDFGNTERLKEECRDSWGTRFMTTSFRDFKYSIRSLLKNRGYSIAVVITLGLCIAGNSIVLQILNEVLGPPSYPDPDRVVEIYNSYPGIGVERRVSSIGFFLDYSESVDAFEELILVDPTTVNLTNERSSIRSMGIRVSDGFFRMMGVQPLLGTFFKEHHFDFSNPRTLVITESVWRTQFGSDPEVLGETLNIDSEAYTIIGVAPQGADFEYEELGFFEPWTWDPNSEERRLRNRFFAHSNLWGKLKPGFTIEQAMQQINAANLRFYEQAPQSVKKRIDRQQHQSRVETFQMMRNERFSGYIYLLQGGALLVLLIGCLNIVSLQLARNQGRMADFAMRKSLGASRLSLLRQISVENLLLCVGSCIIGLIGGVIGVQLITEFVLQDVLPFETNSELNPFSLKWTVLLSIAVTLFLSLCAVIPILREDLGSRIREGNGRSTFSPSLRRFQSYLVSAQVALSFVLVLASALLLRSFLAALHTPVGFEPKGIKTVTMELSQQYRGNESFTRFDQELIPALEGIPGVEGVALSTEVPVAMRYFNAQILLVDEEDTTNTSPESPNWTFVSSRYFDLMGIELLAGRTFSSVDYTSDIQNAIVDQNFAQRYFPNEMAVGRQFYVEGVRRPENLRTIVGVVKNIAHNGLDREAIDSSETGRYPLVYIPRNNAFNTRQFSALIKSERSLEDLIRDVRFKIEELDPHLPIFDVGEVETLIYESLNDRRAFLLLVSSIGVMALLLSAVGIYGVLAFSVSQRTRDIGLKMAVGASRKIILRDILREGLLKTIIGLGVGLFVAFFVNAQLVEYLFQVSPIEPITYFAVTLFLLLIATMASYLPGRRATLIHPMEALRSE